MLYVCKYAMCACVCVCVRVCVCVCMKSTPTLKKQRNKINCLHEEESFHFLFTIEGEEPSSVRGTGEWLAVAGEASTERRMLNARSSSISACARIWKFVFSSAFRRSYVLVSLRDKRMFSSRRFCCSSNNLAVASGSAKE